MLDEDFLDPATGQPPAGFPDLSLYGPGGVAYRHLKEQAAALDPDEITWKYLLHASGQNYDLWRPCDLESGEIERELDLLATSQPARQAPEKSRRNR